MDEPMEGLAKRLDQLEREYRRMKRFGFCILGVIAAALVMGQSQCNRKILTTPIVEAQKFIVRDASGNSRVEMAENGITLTDGHGNILVSLTGIKTDGPLVTEYVGLNFFGTAGEIELSAGSVSPKNPLHPYIGIYDKEHKRQSFIAPDNINLWYNNNERVELSVGASDTSLSFYDNESKSVLPRARLAVTTTGASLDLSDTKHTSRAVLGSAALENSKTGTKIQTSEESLTLFGKDGKVTWQMPR